MSCRQLIKAGAEVRVVGLGAGSTIRSRTPDFNLELACSDLPPADIELLTGELNLRAMGLVYTTLLSLVPLIAFAFAVLKGLGVHRDLEPLIYEVLRPVGVWQPPSQPFAEFAARPAHEVQDAGGQNVGNQFSQNQNADRG